MNTERHYYCHTGDRITIPAGVPLTMYDGLNHAVSTWEDNAPAQMLTKCGRRSCPYSGVREVPARGAVDCPECLNAIRFERDEAKENTA